MRNEAKMHEILARFKVAMEKADLSQSWCAKQVGITPAHLGQVLKLRTNPSQELLKKIDALTSVIDSINSLHSIRTA